VRGQIPSCPPTAPRRCRRRAAGAGFVILNSRGDTCYPRPQSPLPTLVGAHRMHRAQNRARRSTRLPPAFLRDPSLLAHAKIKFQISRLPKKSLRISRRSIANFSLKVWGLPDEASSRPRPKSSCCKTQPGELQWLHQRRKSRTSFTMQELRESTPKCALQRSSGLSACWVLRCSLS
jgi:hypothetical protein